MALATCVFHMVSHVQGVVQLRARTCMSVGGPRGWHVAFESICVLMDPGDVWGRGNLGGCNFPAESWWDPRAPVLDPRGSAHREGP